MSDHKHKKSIKNQARIDAIAEQWVNIVIAQLRAKNKNQLINKKGYKYAE